MLLMLLIGWIVLLPALVVAGLYVGASVLGRRRAALSGYEDLFADELGSGAASELNEVTPEAITGAVAASPAVSQLASPDPRVVGANY